MTQAVSLFWCAARVTQASVLFVQRSADAGLFLVSGRCTSAGVEALWDGGAAIAGNSLARG